MRKQVRIFRWRDPDLTHGNFGDEITAPLLERLFDVDALPSRMREAQLIGAGSILDAWFHLRGHRRFVESLAFHRSTDLHIWGSGFILPDSEADWPQQLHYHAVRGALTSQRIGRQVPIGDPGILASLIVEKLPPKQHSVGLVPHYIDVDRLRATMALPDNWILIDPRNPVDAVLSAIASCELIVSSSLHGLIVADSFGIPCVWARTVEPLYGSSGFKFADYASARRGEFNRPIDYEAALRADGSRLAELATTPGRSVDEWQQELMAAFPRDL
jgi:hypothetical protein